MDNITLKKEIRRESLKRRNKLTSLERERATMLLTEKILGHQWYYLSDTILGFASYGSEIDTSEILEDALQKGKKVYLPKVIGEDMIFYRIQSMDDLQEGYKGIPEPVGDTEIFDFEVLYNKHVVKENCNNVNVSTRKDASENVLMLMPGAAFDMQRNRIGYGKGFYDRYLQDKEELQLRTIAVGFQCQMVEEIPADEFDIKPYQIICV